MARLNRRGKNRIMSVREADPVNGPDSVKIDRQIAAIKTSESQCRVVCGDFRDLPLSTAENVGTYDFSNILATDDFNSLAGQYNLFRITSIKFRVVDVNPGVSAYNEFGTSHASYQGSAPSFTRANVADLPDARIISGGTGEAVFYWRAHGTRELEFQSTSAASTPYTFGGLQWYISANTGPSPKYIVQIHAVVDFRGRK
jgi:hypothetical protein